MSERAVFAAGCFWGVEEYFLRLEGVLDTRVGYAGGQKKSPTYEEVCTGKTGHAEVVEIEFDPSEISYADLLAHFWEMHEPTRLNAQGPDIGTQYRSAIFPLSSEQRQLATKAKEEKIQTGLKIVTSIEEMDEFWEAEDYHQKYLRKNPGRGCHVSLPPLKEKA